MVGTACPFSIAERTIPAEYPGAVTLRPVTIGGKGTMTLGSTTTLLKWTVDASAGSTVSVDDQIQPKIGGLSGAGTVDMSRSPSEGFEETDLSLNPPPGDTEEFDGEIHGAGGILSLDSGNVNAGQNAGTQVIDRITSDDSHRIQLQINSGTMLVNDSVNAEQLTVASGATFGGPATMKFMGPSSDALGDPSPDVAFDSGSTFAVTLNGTSIGQFSQLKDTDEDAGTPPDDSTVQLGNSDLSVSIGSGYIPKLGNAFPIILTSSGTIGGEFANAPDGAIKTFDNVQFLVTYTENSISLKVVSAPSRCFLEPCRGIRHSRASPVSGRVRAGHPRSAPIGR